VGATSKRERFYILSIFRRRRKEKKERKKERKAKVPRSSSKNLDSSRLDDVEVLVLVLLVVAQSVRISLPPAKNVSGRYRFFIVSGVFSHKAHDKARKHREGK